MSQMDNLLYNNVKPHRMRSTIGKYGEKDGKASSRWIQRQDSEGGPYY